MLERRDTMFIQNPCAGARRRGCDIDVEDIAKSVQGYGERVEVARTLDRGHATEIARDALLKGFTQIVVVGGDGTIREVATALAHSEAVMAIVPTGSENVVARAAGINLSNAREVILFGDIHRIDTGLIDGERFVANAGIGVHAEVFHGVQPVGEPKDGTGLARYVREAIDKLPKHRGNPALVTVDGEETFSDHLSEIIALNFPTLPILNRFTNRRVLNGYVDNGLLDCFVATAEKPSDLVFPAVATAITKRGNNTTRIMTCSSIIVDFSMGRVAKAQADGDSIPDRSHREIKNDPGSLLLKVPRGSNAIYQEAPIS